MDENEGSLYKNSNLSLSQKLEKSRAELLDLTARNRLLHIPKSKTTKFLEVVNERSDILFKMLFEEGKPFTFLHGREDKKTDENSETDSDSEDIIFLDDSEANHTDTKLQTKLTPKTLQKKLLDLYYDSKTLEEEQGVNILFLSLGSLKWIDPNNKANIRYAPLLLLPVELMRAKVGERFKIKVRDEDIISNLSLETFLNRIHQIILPTLNIDDEFSLTDYFAEIKQTISLKVGWEVLENEVNLGLFSYAKFMMYTDLDPDNWPLDSKITDQEAIRCLLETGFSGGELISDDIVIDSVIPPREMLHILDSDSSQTLAIHEVRNGKSLVIQGPPGTGKSQTIANIIASAVADGKKVLFVAEKMAALEVVKRRLDQAGVGDACIELHSNKTNKRAFLEELKRVWELASPRGEFPDTLVNNLSEIRDILNTHPIRIHKKYMPFGLTPYKVMAQLIRLRQSGYNPNDYNLSGYELWRSDDFDKRHALIDELIERISDIGIPDSHSWNGINRTEILPSEVERLTASLTNLKSEFSDSIEESANLSKLTNKVYSIESLNELQEFIRIAELINSAPKLSPESLSSSLWATSKDETKSLIEAGFSFKELYSELESQLHTDKFNTEVVSLTEDYRKLPADINIIAFNAAYKLKALTPKILKESSRLQQELGSKIGFSNLNEIESLIELGESITQAPNVSPEAFIATVWEGGIEKAANLVADIKQLSIYKEKINVIFVEKAWKIDVESARNSLENKTGAFKFLNSEWRKSKNLTLSLIYDKSLTIPQQVEYLELLIKAQKLRQSINDMNDFGQSAFSSDWRGENSDSELLKSLVEWMRTLRGINSEARTIASRLSNKDALAYQVSQLKKLIHEILDEIRILWDSLGTTPEEYFDNCYSVKNIPLESLLQKSDLLSTIDSAYNEIFVNNELSVSDRIELLNQLSRTQQKLKVIHSFDSIAQLTMYPFWLKENSDWELLFEAYSWIEANNDLRIIASKIDDKQVLVDKARNLSESIQAQFAKLTSTISSLSSSYEAIFNNENIHEITFKSVYDKITLWIDNSEQLSKWVAWQNRVELAKKFGIYPLVSDLSSGVLSSERLLGTFDRTYFDSILSLMVEDEPELARFDGDLHSRRVASFAEMDLRRIKASSFEVVRAHHRAIPSKVGVGPVGVLRGEMARKRGHMAIRQLMIKAGAAIQALKPVMMMSPLSVAQFLAPGKQSFDLLVMDEASQIQPVDALGAIARSKQIVVVGDERQLPPTSFFAKMTGSADDQDDDDSTQVADIESILGLFVARGLPQKMLRWHYRSRHQSLIAVSNSQFYENKLYIVPSPYTQEAGMGLRFHKVEDGVFESGSNANEAKRVATAILEHARSHPNLSLGVATFSVTQRRRIQDELEVLRRLNPEFEDFFYAHPSEPFFVKNLENIQGDERDVIIISVGYARNPQNYMAMRFGPLGAEGGERRLNVLISRAKRRCEVYASITDEDIDHERAKGRGVFAFKLFLQYARTGRLSVAEQSCRSMESVFEEQVANALQKEGYQVHPQVGIAGFFIDLAIADSDMPGRYLIGIECDGMTYHSSRSSRERDRLRQAVLEDHGWIIHRIWSTDWFQRPEEQLQKTLSAIQAAKKELENRSETSLSRSRAVPVEIVTVERETVTEIGLETIRGSFNEAAAYIESVPEVDTRFQIHETPVGVLAKIVEQIVLVEAPIHVNEVIIRIRSAWGLQRAGARIEAIVKDAIKITTSNISISLEEDFLYNDSLSIKLRDRTNIKSAGLRKLENISNKEMEAGIIDIINKSFGATQDELVNSVSRAMGFKATSGTLKNIITSIIEKMESDNKIVYKEPMYHIEQ
ncbi:DUF3320 domain-containing protein [Erwiniaceae bacterium BAC15a-03b]|uniref:DUF3320 domain-containing protein n=1 Tax=Winslowiella arboricola TaxID=2978220 RepID=A0A9J6PMW6_9GAMM|nr:DUF3320 domain-containing protein [Winslowiella arboricola]MCU5773147.1 DUF3320 domain-containing protein [Winslowiella arboricola]MCU5778730.1 DUF3320 domain-containing protein [Winslowiella arboricola]